MRRPFRNLAVHASYRLPLGLALAASLLFACSTSGGGTTDDDDDDDGAGGSQAGSGGGGSAGSGGKGGSGGSGGKGGSGGQGGSGGSGGQGGGGSGGKGGSGGSGTGGSGAGGSGTGGSGAGGSGTGGSGTGGTGGATAPTPTISITQPTAGSKVPGSMAVEVLVTATVAAPATIARVEIVEGDAILGTSTTAPFTVSFPPLPTGMRTLVARAVTGDAQTANSTPVSFTLVGPPTVALTQPAANATLPAGLPTTLQATATSTGDAIAKVVFFDGEMSLGEVTAPPFSLANITLMSGARALSAVAHDGLGQTTKSATVNVTVGAGSTGAFLEQEGRIVFEAEDFTSATPNGDFDWVVQTTDTGFMGAGYVVVPTPNFNVKAADDPLEASAELNYALSFTGTGTYHAYARRRFDANSSDSLYFRLNAGTNTLVSGGTLGASFIWAYLGTINVTAAGSNTFTLKRRESNAKVDRLVIDKVMQLPTGDGPAVSPRAP